MKDTTTPENTNSTGFNKVAYRGLINTLLYECVARASRRATCKEQLLREIDKEIGQLFPNSSLGVRVK